MCQLLGMNCATPTDFNFSFRGFARRGGETDKHEHGWGLVIYEGRGLRTFHDSQPAADSDVAHFVEGYPIKTLNMMAHIRYATQGKVALENVHPFQREMFGINWSFAHNGEVPKYSNKPYSEYPLLGRLTNRDQNFYHPVGDTDSEACELGFGFYSSKVASESPCLSPSHILTIYVILPFLYPHSPSFCIACSILCNIECFASRI